MKHSTTRTPRAAVLSQLAQARLDGAFLGACARVMFKEYTP